MEGKGDKSPPEAAEEMGTTGEHVLRLIRGGHLEAYNVAEDPNGKPRYKITPEAIQRFRERRAAVPPTRKTRRVRKDVNAGRFYQ